MAHFFRRAFQRDLPTVHHIAVLGNAKRELNVLLDNNDRHLACELLQAMFNLIDDARPDPLGGLVQHYQARPPGEITALEDLAAAISEQDLIYCVGLLDYIPTKVATPANRPSLFQA